MQKDKKIQGPCLPSSFSKRFEQKKWLGSVILAKSEEITSKLSRGTKKEIKETSGKLTGKVVTSTCAEISL